MKYESNILKRLIDTYGVVGNPRYISEIIKEFIVQGKERFPNLFTYQSDWLAHIDEFGLNPSYTVSYTGQSIYAPNTLERPVKSAILKGQTVKRYKDNLFDGIVESGGLGINSGENDDRYPSRCRSANFIKVEPNSTITFARNLGTDGFHVVSYNENKEFIKGFTDVMKANVLVGKINTTSDIYYIKFYDVAPTSESEFGVFQGDVEPTYELASVKMPGLKTVGKNLFNGELENGAIVSSTGANTPSTDNVRSVGYIKVKPNTSIVLSNDLNYSNNIIYEYDSNKNYIGRKTTNPFTTSTNCHYIRFRSDANQPNLDVKYQIEYGTQATSYEPYKTNILTVNEPIELRGIGDVKDELNCLTGEVTERIGEIVLNEDITGYLDTNYSVNGYSAFRVTSITNIPNALRNVICDKVKYYPNFGLDWTKQEEFFTSNGGLLFIKLLSTKARTFEELKLFLTSSPITIQYELSEKSVKTVALNILDQNGHNIKQLMSFNGGTHFNTGSAEGSPLPVVSVSVETDLEETLKVCSLEGNTM